MESKSPLAGTRLTPAQIEESIAAARTGGKRATTTTYQSPRRHPLEGVKFTPAMVEQAIRNHREQRAGYSTTTKSTPVAPSPTQPVKVVSIHQSGPPCWPGWQKQMMNRTFDAVGMDLGLKEIPDVRWFDESVQDVQFGVGWRTVQGEGTPWGLYDPDTREVWLSTTITPDHLQGVIAHELVHAKQHEKHGRDFFRHSLDAAEAEASSYANKWK